MKITTHRFRNLLGFAAISGFSMAPFAVMAQEPNPAPPPAAEQKPDLQKVRGMVREMVELKRAGKNEEASQMAERIKAATGNNPRVVEMLERHQKGPGPQAQANEPRKPEERPKAKERKKDAKGPEAADLNPRERIQHLRKAAEHLDAAGIKGLANAVRAQIAGIERRIQNAGTLKEKAEPRRERAEAKERPMRFGQQPNTPFGRPGPRFGGPAPQRLGFQGPGQQAKPEAGPADPNAALIGEIRKLRQEMGELRGQVKRLQSNAERAPKRPHAPMPPVDRPQ